MMDRFVFPEADYEQRARSSPRFSGIDTETLMAMEFPPIRWIVPGYVPEGLSILAGRQKLGKTWLAVDWAVAVASGGYAMASVPCQQGDVLYVDLENGPRRMRGRLDTLFAVGGSRPCLPNLMWVNQAPLMNKGLLSALDHWRQSANSPRLVIIDVLQRIKPPGNAAQTSYESDYATFAPLQAWAMEHSMAVVALHHTRKAGADDPLEALSGSNGLSACADTTLVLDRGSNGLTLYVRGRDVEEKETALNFIGGLWNVTGEASYVRRSSERGNILGALGDATEPMSPTEIADVTAMKSGNVRKLLHAMAKAGEVNKIKRGLYVAAARSEV
jgi:hypothetical protein